MNEFRWEDISIGLKAGFEATFTAKDAGLFAEISGDTNPLHTEEIYAVHAGFPSPVLFGMLTSSLYSKLIGVFLPGKYALLQGIDIDFNAPAYPGERLHCEGTVSFISEAFHRFEVKASIRNQDRKLVSKALIRVGFHVQ